MKEIKCTKCKLIGTEKDFFKRADSLKGYRSHCKTCLRDKDREYNRENVARLTAKGLEWRLANVDRTLLSTARNRAKKKGREFDIELSDISVPTHCPILGTELIKQVGKMSPCSPSLDRIDSSKGYIKGNVHVISHRANMLKNNATIEEIEKLLSWMKRGE